MATMSMRISKKSENNWQAGQKIGVWRDAYHDAGSLVIKLLFRPWYPFAAYSSTLAAEGSFPTSRRGIVAAREVISVSRRILPEIRREEETSMSQSCDSCRQTHRATTTWRYTA
jgi:hypothetical protein